MAKNFLNSEEKVWVDILKFKYRSFNLSSHYIPQNYSWLFRFLCRTAQIIRPHTWIKFINPHATRFFNNPWYFETQLALKPAFLNMDLDVGNLDISKLINETRWDMDKIRMIFSFWYLS